MRIVLNIDADTVGGPRAVATIARGYLRGLILQDRILIRRGLVPSIYGAFRRGELEFRPEPEGQGFEEFADALECMKRGHGDCDDLVPWRCAEWIEKRGVLALPKVYWRLRDEDGEIIHDPRRWRDAATTSYHAEVRLPCKCHGLHRCANAAVEDVAALVGMARRGRRPEGGARARRAAA